MGFQAALPVFQFTDANNELLSGGKLYTYVAGSSTLKATWQDEALTTANTNPIILNSRGELPFGMWLDDSSYKFILKDSADVLIWERDDLTGINNVASSFSEWPTAGFTPTYISSTSFSVAGDQTGTYEPYRAIRCTVSAGTVYGYILTSSYAASITTVTVQLKSGVLDSGISVADVGVISYENSSLPSKQAMGIGVKGSAIASATTIDLDTQFLVYDFAHITGTTPITTVTLSAGRTYRAIADAALPLTHSANLIVQGGKDYTCTAGDELLFIGDGSSVVYVFIKKNQLETTNKRQTVVAGSVDANGAANFLSAGTGLAVNLAATTTPVIISAANGFDANGNPVNHVRVEDADVTGAWSSLTDATTNYLFELYSGGSWTRVSKLLKPIYQRGGTIDVTNNQFTFDISAMKAYLGNGASADEVIMIAVGEAVTSGGAVTSATTYALNGEYVSPSFTLANNTLYTKYHNIGEEDVDIDGFMRYTTAYDWMQIDSLWNGTYWCGASIGLIDHNAMYMDTANDMIIAGVFTQAGDGTNRNTGLGYLVAKRRW